MISLDAVKDFKVLVVGDAIRDEYVYVRALGKAVKEAALSLQELKKEEFSGGAHAGGNHIKGFCSEVDVSTSPIINVTRRLVEETYLRKITVLHSSEARGSSRHYDIGAYDLVIVTDFGYGTLTPELIAKLSKEARFLAVNAQTNAPNYGFNMITKYPRADYVVVDELEARLAAHDKDGDIEDVILKLGFKKIIVTLGANGAIGFDGAFERAKAATNMVKETMGAGDAFLCVTSPFAAAGASMKDLIRIGNAAGAAKTQIIGHRASVTKESLKAYLNGQ